MRYNNKHNDKLNVINGDATQAAEDDSTTSATCSDDTTGRVQWHTGFVHAMRLYLKERRISAHQETAEHRPDRGQET